MNILENIKLLEDNFIYVLPQLESLGSDEWGFSCVIKWLPKEHWDEKRRMQFFKDKESFICGSATYAGAWDTIQEAMWHGIEKAKELLPVQ